MVLRETKILVVDDEASICDGCRIALTDHGCIVDICRQGKPGLTSLLTGSYDVALLDIKLPDFDGMEILKTAWKQKIDTRIIIMTGYSTVAGAVEAMKHGAFDYLTKPFTEDELLNAVRRAVERKRVSNENLMLRKRSFYRSSFGNIIGDDQKMLKIFEQIEKVAASDAGVLLFGESGTGKELFARAIHARSPRATYDFVAADCNALSSGLLESELFGHVKGAFTGALIDKIGLFEAADKGSLFLDEVANLDLGLQSKLLRVLETREFKPVGASVVKRSGARIIAATNRNLEEMVDCGEFRGDLYYRLNVVPIYIPPLRDRRKDIPELAYYFLREFCRETGKQIEGFDDDALELLINYDWPGNVRQLKNVVKRLVIMTDQRIMDLVQLIDMLQIRTEHHDDSVPETAEKLQAYKKRLLEQTFGSVQKAFLIKALRNSEGNITKAAEFVGMKRPNFQTLMKKHGLNVDEILKEDGSQ